VDRPYCLAVAREVYGKPEGRGRLHVLAEALAVMDTIEERYYEAELYRLKVSYAGALCGGSSRRRKPAFRHALAVARHQQPSPWNSGAAMS